MPDLSRRTPGRYGFALAVVAIIVAGCGGQDTLENAGVRGLKPSSGWTRVETSRYTVPGRSLAAWSGPEGSSFVVSSTLAAPRVNAEGLLREALVRLENLPELRVVQTTKRTVAGIESAYLEILAPGTGDALAATGLGRPIPPEGKTLVPTRRISIGIPVASRTVWLVWHAPDSSSASLRVEIESMIGELKIHDRPPTPY